MTSREALSALAGAQKSNSGAPAYTRYVNRPLGRWFAAVAYKAGLRPNQVTAISAAFTFCGVLTIALVPPSPISGAIIVLLLLIGYALDAADGQLSRLLRSGSVAGEWLDHTVDAFKMSSIHAAVLICWARFYDVSPAWLLVPLAFQIVSSVFFAQVLLADLLRRIASAKGSVASPPASYRMSWSYSVAVLPADFGLLACTFFLIDYQPLFIAVYSALFVVNAALLLFSCRRWFLSMKTLG